FCCSRWAPISPGRRACTISGYRSCTGVRRSESADEFAIVIAQASLDRYMARPRLRRLVSASEPARIDMINVTFPDGASRAYEPGVPGLDIAKSIPPSLAKRTVAAVRDGIVVDLADPVDEGCSLEFISRDDPRALELIRHDAAHVLAEAV